MTFAVVTTFSPKGYEVYGRRFIESFAQHWPADVPLYVYHEGEKPTDANPRANWMPLDDDKDRARFMETHQDKPDRADDYRWCVVRYSHKVWAQTAAPRDTDHLIWTDADCETFAPVTEAMLRAVCGDQGQAGSFLGRPYHRHSETGFISYNMKSCGDWLLDALRQFYVLGDVLNLSEWHDCMAYDFMRRKFERAGHRFKNICPDAKGLSVFEQSPLKAFIRHNKGPDRKQKTYGDSMLSMEEVA